MPGPFTLSKDERLKHKKDIDTLFLQGKAFFIFPYKVLYLFRSPEANSVSEIKFGIAVPKRSFKRAVDRNYLKRISRELYRLQKPRLKEPLTCSINLMLVYTHTEKKSFHELQPVVSKIIDRLILASEKEQTSD
ncbi:MAG TPA: ribonuclease P protein component [Chitinophagaceae bacterium]|nr:ribonuclease P protein component [Chitinophagaceae bacterium]